MEIHHVGVELFHADGRRAMTKLIITFGNFAKAPKLCNIYTCNRYSVEGQI
jgi:hypothetical protein